MGSNPRGDIWFTRTLFSEISVSYRLSYRAGVLSDNLGRELLALLRETAFMRVNPESDEVDPEFIKIPPLSQAQQEASVRQQETPTRQMFRPINFLTLLSRARPVHEAGRQSPVIHPHRSRHGTRCNLLESDGVDAVTLNHL